MALLSRFYPKMVYINFFFKNPLDSSCGVLDSSSIFSILRILQEFLQPKIAKDAQFSSHTNFKFHVTVHQYSLKFFRNSSRDYTWNFTQRFPFETLHGFPQKLPRGFRNCLMNSFRNSLRDSFVKSSVVPSEIVPRDSLRKCSSKFLRFSSRDSLRSFYRYKIPHGISPEILLAVSARMSPGNSSLIPVEILQRLL